MKESAANETFLRWTGDIGGLKLTAPQRVDARFGAILTGIGLLGWPATVLLVANVGLSPILLIVTPFAAALMMLLGIMVMENPSPPAIIEISRARLRVRAQLGGWLPRWRKRTVPLECVQISWSPSPFRMHSTWSVQIDAANVRMHLCHVRCSEQELVLLREIIRTYGAKLAPEIGTSDDVPEGLLLIPGIVTHVRPDAPRR